MNPFIGYPELLKTSALSPSEGTKVNPSGSKNYIGMTLKEYINSKEMKQSMQQIQQESSESVLTNSPTCKNSPNIVSLNKNKLKAKQKQELLNIVHNILHHPQAKISKINVEECYNFDKNSQKLPAIHQQRAAVISRNAISKEEGQEIKKQRCHTLKTQEIDIANEATATLRKNIDKYKFNDQSKHSLQMKKIGRPRISTSFYHMQMKERMRMKTDDNSGEKHLQQMFMITRYKQYSQGKKKKAQQHIFKKY